MEVYIRFSGEKDSGTGRCVQEGMLVMPTMGVVSALKVFAYFGAPVSSLLNMYSFIAVLCIVLTGNWSALWRERVSGGIEECQIEFSPSGTQRRPTFLAQHAQFCVDDFVYEYQCDDA